MASIKDIPLGSLKSVVDGFKSSEASRRSCVRIAIELDEGVPQDLVNALKDALMPKSQTALLHIAALKSGKTVRINPDCDLALVVSGTGGLAIGAANAFAHLSIPCAIIVESSVEVASDEIEQGVSLLCASNPSSLLEKLADWMVATNVAELALASNFDFIRQAVTKKCITERSMQNAVVGALPFGNNADMPIMCANQVLMTLDIAGAHGKEASIERLGEIASVVGVGFLSRSVARSTLGKLPGTDWLLRAAIGAGATYFIGYALELTYAVQDAWKKRV